MQGDPQVLTYLNRYFRIELTGHKQYLLNAGQLAHWGYGELAAKQHAYGEEETAHARRLMARILFLGGTPELADHRPIVPVADVTGQLRQDLSLIADAIGVLREAVTCCSAQADFVSRDLFVEMLADEEAHYHWLETQLALQAQMGSENYLQSGS
ncbi:MAG: bacterioferritin [Gammaproteobacteria bacterium]|nr:bacterioferritin [Gammaproteobacteria bacterium]